LSRCLRSADWDTAIDATRTLMARAQRAGTSLLERYGFLERFGEVTLRTLERAGADRQVLLGTSRLCSGLRRVALADSHRAA
jgi:hypothetical protein